MTALSPLPDAPILPPEAPERIDPLVEVCGLSKRFGPLQVLRDVDLRFRRGRVTAVVGPNGCGKTTLVKTLLGLVRPDSGRVLFDGVAVDTGAVAHRARIGYMPQRAAFPENLTGRMVLAMLADLRTTEGAPAPDDALIETLGLEAELDKPIRTLSGGTRQKLNAAIAFRFRPDVVVLDEPTAGLDPVASGVLQDAVRAARERGVTLVLTSHIVSELEALADEVVFLSNGRPAFVGPVAELKRTAGEDRLDRAIARLMTAPRS